MHSTISHSKEIYGQLTSRINPGVYIIFKIVLFTLSYIMSFYIIYYFSFLHMSLISMPAELNSNDCLPQ
jgi:hypothetical protein